MKTRTTAVVLVWATVLLAIGVAWLGAGVASRSGTDTNGSITHITYMDGYPLDNSPSAAVSFAGNETIVLAQVIEVLSPRWNVKAGARPAALAFIFTPVRVKVLEVLRGVPRLDDGAMIVRQLGGRVDQDEFVASTDVAAHLTLGSRFVLFLGEQRDLGDGLDAVTPNIAYLVDDVGMARSADGHWEIDLQGLQAIIGSSDIAR